MSEDGIVEKLLRGSRNIDRMEQEVKMVVGTLVGSMFPLIDAILEVNPAVTTSNSWMFRCGDSFRWLLHVDRKGLVRIRGVEIIVGMSELTIYSCECQLGKLSHSNMTATSVRTLRVALPTLVEKMLGEFPELKMSLDPLFEAAEVVETDDSLFYEVPDDEPIMTAVQRMVQMAGWLQKPIRSNFWNTSFTVRPGDTADEAFNRINRDLETRCSR